ncbi:MAG: hypothetical protein EAZ85_11315 [Bacteroidetes bacterium]|nr:MAG: hypothetical protein EAZ85_11315 [Bacteroidota bacterium]TAG85150.1 MAG: hypothetical protein EAZ20_15920 [Bacteroidota bacterium]
MKKVLIFTLLIIVCQISILSAQNKKDTRKDTKKKMTEKTFEGKIEKKPWSKSTQSYCARGSEYFVLVLPDQTEHVIQNNSKTDLEALDGQQVKITGKMETRVIKANPMEQRPINPFEKDDGTFRCEVLAVSKIEKK